MRKRRKKTTKMTSRFLIGLKQSVTTYYVCILEPPLYIERGVGHTAYVRIMQSFGTGALVITIVHDGWTGLRILQVIYGDFSSGRSRRGAQCGNLVKE